MFSRLKQRVAALAQGPHADAALFLVAFSESAFQPVLADLVLAPVAAAQPQRWVRLALIATAGSLIGAMLGYAIGYFAAETLGAWMFETFGVTERFNQFRAMSTDALPWVVLVYGLTPISFKWIALASGAVKAPLALFMACTLVTRTVRFFVVAYVFKRFGPSIGAMIERRLGIATAILALAIIAVVAAIYWLH